MVITFKLFNFKNGAIKYTFLSKKVQEITTSQGIRLEKAAQIWINRKIAIKQAGFCSENRCKQNSELKLMHILRSSHQYLSFQALRPMSWSKVHLFEAKQKKGPTRWTPDRGNLLLFVLCHQLWIKNTFFLDCQQLPHETINVAVSREGCRENLEIESVADVRVTDYRTSGIACRILSQGFSVVLLRLRLDESETLWKNSEKNYLTSRLDIVTLLVLKSQKLSRKCRFLEKEFG